MLASVDVGESARSIDRHRLRLCEILHPRPELRAKFEKRVRNATLTAAYSATAGVLRAVIAGSVGRNRFGIRLGETTEAQRHGENTEKIPFVLRDSVSLW